MRGKNNCLWLIAVFSDLSPMPKSPEIFADVLLPLAIEQTYTYRIPVDLAQDAAFGKRAEVQFGSRRKYAGLIVSIHTKEPGYRTKSILSVLDEHPIMESWQYDFWKWMADYYCCTIGEVMKAALPGAWLLSSETVIRPIHTEEDVLLQLDDQLYEIARIVQSKVSLTLDDLQRLSGKKTVYPQVVKLYQLGMLVVQEHLAEKYKPKTIRLVRLHPEYITDEKLEEALEQIGRYEKQVRVLLSYLAMATDRQTPVEPDELLQKSDVGKSVLKCLTDKGIFEQIDVSVNRMDRYIRSGTEEQITLSEKQVEALNSIRQQWEKQEVVLLHGVTGSGKTHVYIELIREVIQKGGQVLYLVPEIGMSVQLLRRLQSAFGDQITISHSRLNENERVDLWQQVREGIPVIAGVRSAIFLPFQNLKLVIVDEEHDISYKQQDPSPRYHARDMAILLARDLGAKVLLGSATPSIDTFFQTESERFGIVTLSERYQGLELPKVVMIDSRKDKSSAGSVYSHSLIEEIKSNLKKDKQIILFRNRRGYAPVMKCQVCGWTAACHQCDVTLTYHKARHVLMCHLCGTVQQIPHTCPACGSPKILLEGYGTEKIEDEVSVIFPDAKIGRMDLDTTRGKNKMEELIWDFEHRKIDILIGTQMVTKGLDFDHVGLVGVVQADQALHYPDFRAAERTYQTLVQVSGRAGRKFDQGTVMIQTFQPDHPVYKDVIDGNYRRFYTREIAERELFKYPPLVRQIAITIRHRHFDLSQEAAKWMALELKKKFGERILGPSVPAVGRVRNQYLHMIHIKMERDTRLIAEVKRILKLMQNEVVKKKALSTVRIAVDVDPYH